MHETERDHAAKGWKIGREREGRTSLMKFESSGRSTWGVPAYEEERIEEQRTTLTTMYAIPSIPTR